MSDQTPYERAIARIEATAELGPHRATILYDWPESDEFYTWAATCELWELLDWAERVECDVSMRGSERQILVAPGWVARERERRVQPRRGGRHAA